MEDGLLNKDALIIFIKSVLLKIENVENLMNHVPINHIPAYNKILGIRQKFDILSHQQRQQLFPYLVMIRGVIALFLNGKYEDGMKQLLTIKDGMIKIVSSIERKGNERNP